MSSMVVEVRYRHQKPHMLRCSHDLTDTEILHRFAVAGDPCVVTVWPETHPEAARIIQRLPASYGVIA